MNDATAFYILARVWGYLLTRRPYDYAAQMIVSNLKAAIIRNASPADYAHINMLIDCMAWKQDAFDIEHKEAA